MEAMTLVAKKKTEKTKQINFRATVHIWDRLEKAAQSLGLDPSHLMRMILAEKLPEYEERARRAQAKES